MLLNNQQITEEIKKEIKICIETNENENMTTQNLWHSVKSVLRGRLICRKRRPSAREDGGVSGVSSSCGARGYSTPQSLGCFVFIFIRFYAYFDFVFDFFCDLLVIQHRVVQPLYVGIFSHLSLTSQTLKAILFTSVQ